MTTNEYGMRVVYTQDWPKVEEDTGKLLANTKAWLEQTKSTMRITFEKTAPFFDDEKQDRDIYSVELSRGGRTYTPQFGQSVACSARWRWESAWATTKYEFGGRPIYGNYKPNVDRRQPSAGSVLMCLEYNNPGTFEEFCDEYGYDTDSRKAEKIWRACIDQYLALSAMYSPDELEALGRLED